MQSANVVRLLAAVCALSCGHTYSATITTTTTTTTAAPPNTTSTTTTTTKAPLAVLEAEVDMEDNEAAPAGSSVQIAPWQQQLSPAPYPAPSTPAAPFPPPPPPPSTSIAPASTPVAPAPAASDVEIVRSVELDFVFDNDRNGSVSRPYGRPPVNQTLTAAASAFRPGTPVAFSARDIVLAASVLGPTTAINPGPATAFATVPGPATANTATIATTPDGYDVHGGGGGLKASRPRRRTIAAPAPEDFRLESRSLLGPVLLRRSDALYVAPAPRRTARLRTTLAETATRDEAENLSPHEKGETATQGEADNPTARERKGETAATNPGDLAGKPEPEAPTRGTARHPSGRAPPRDSAAGETSLNPSDRARSPAEGETATRGAATNARDRSRSHAAAETPTRGRTRHPSDTGASETATRGSTRNPTPAVTAPSDPSEDQAEASQELPFGAKTERGAVKFRPTEPPVDSASPNHNDPGQPQRIVVTPVHPQRHTPFRHHAHEVAAGLHSSVSSQGGHEVGSVRGHSSVSIQHGNEFGGVSEDPHIVVTPVHPPRPQAERHSPIRHAHQVGSVGEDAGGHSSVSIQHGHVNTPIRHSHKVAAGLHSSVSSQSGNEVRDVAENAGHSSVSIQHGHEGVGVDARGHSSVSSQSGHEVGSVGENAGGHSSVSIQSGHEVRGVSQDARGHSSLSIQHGNEVGSVTDDSGGHSSVSIQRGHVDTLPYAPADVRLQPNPLGPAQVIFIQPYAPPPTPPPRPAHRELPTPPVLDTHQWVPVYVQEAYVPFLLQHQEHHLPHHHHHQQLRLEEHHRHPDEAWPWASHQDSTSSIPNESISDNKFF